MEQGRAILIVLGASGEALKGVSEEQGETGSGFGDANFSSIGSGVCWASEQAASRSGCLRLVFRRHRQGRVGWRPRS